MGTLGIAAVIFDFFGVLAEQDEQILIDRIAIHCPDPDKAKHQLKGVSDDPDLITGRIDLEHLRRRLSKQLGLDMSHEAFDRAWREPYSWPANGLMELVESLAKRCKLVLLTNVDGDYWNSVCCDDDILRPFSACLPSFEMGVAKPQPEAYRRAVTASGQPAERCLMIDDTQENIDAAAALGMQTHHYCDVESLRAELQRRCLL
jgi:putative hydrolase of the HAD superfamily